MRRWLWTLLRTLSVEVHPKRLVLRRHTHPSNEWILGSLVVRLLRRSLNLIVGMEGSRLRKAVKFLRGLRNSQLWRGVPCCDWSLWIWPCAVEIFGGLYQTG